MYWGREFLQTSALRTFTEVWAEKGGPNGDQADAPTFLGPHCVAGALVFGVRHEGVAAKRSDTGHTGS